MLWHAENGGQAIGLGRSAGGTGEGDDPYDGKLSPAFGIALSRIDLFAEGLPETAALAQDVHVFENQPFAEAPRLLPG